MTSTPLFPAPGIDQAPPPPLVQSGKSIDLNAETVILALTIRRPGNRRTLTAGEVTVRARQADLFDSKEETDPDMIHVGKTLLESETLKLIIKRQGELRRWIYARALPSDVLKAGCYRLSVKLIADVEDRLSQETKDLAGLVDEFIEFYPSIVEQAKAKLRELFDPEDYPEPDELRQAFSIKWAYIMLATPTGQLSTISAALAHREQEKAAAAVRAELDSIRGALYAEFSGLVTHMVDRLSTAPGEKAKTFRDSLVTNMTEWLDLLESRNATGDGELAALAAKARGLLQGVDPATLRTDKTFRAQVAQNFAEIKAAVSAYVVTKPARKIALDSEEV